MKVACLTDTHFGCRNSSPAFMNYQRKCFEWFIQYLDDNGISHVIHLGDCFDVRKHITHISAKLARDTFLLPLHERGIEAHIICGNHDQTFKNTHEINALDELITGRYPNIHTHITPSIITIDGLDIQTIPWITESNYDLAMEAITKPRAEVAFGHLEVTGFIMHKGEVAKSGLDRSVFSNFDKVFSGHYHHHSIIGNINYIGAFAETTWVDFNDPRGFSIFDTETRTMTMVQNPYSMFHVIKFDNMDFETVQNMNYDYYEDTIVKVLAVNKDDQYLFDMFVDNLTKAGPIDLKIIEDASVLIEEDNEELAPVEDTKTMINQYIEGLTLNVKQDRLKSFMTEIYEEALETEG